MVIIKDSDPQSASSAQAIPAASPPPYNPAPGTSWPGPLSSPPAGSPHPQQQHYHHHPQQHLQHHHIPPSPTFLPTPHNVGYSEADAQSRALRRFWEALLWAVLIYLLTGILFGSWADEVRYRGKREHKW